MKTVDIKTYNFRLHLSIGDEVKKIIQYINRKVKKSNSKVDEEDTAELIRSTTNKDYVAFYLGLNLSGHGIVWFNLDHIKEMDAITLSHEVIHACIDIFEHIGSSVNKETEENFCYLHDFLMRECLGEIEKVKNGDNIKIHNSARPNNKMVASGQSSTEA